MRDAYDVIIVGAGPAGSMTAMLLAQQGLSVLLLERDVFGLVPFSWGARAAVHAGRGEILAYLVWAGASALALAAVVGVSVALAERLYRGELDVGEAGPRASSRARSASSIDWRIRSRRASIACWIGPKA